MNAIFGIPTNDIMLALILAFVLCIGGGAVVLVRNRAVVKLGVRNIPRRPAQTTLIIIGLMLSTLIIAAAFTTGDSLDASIKAEMLRIIGQSDERIAVASSPTDTGAQTGAMLPEELVYDLESRLRDNADIDGFLPVLAESVPAIDTRTRLSEPALTLTGLDPSRLAPFGGIKDRSGRAIDLAALPDNGVVLSATAAEKLDASVGDVLTSYVRNQPLELRVEAIAPDSLLTGYLDPWSAGGFTMSLDRAQAILGYPGQISAIEVTNRGGVEGGVKRSDQVTAALNQALEGTPYRALPSKQNDLKSAEQDGNTFLTIFMVFGLFSISVGLLLIFLIFVMLAAERKPELGIARAVGLKRRQLTEMFLAEGITYDALSALVGAVLGVLVAFLMAGFMGRLLGDLFPIQATASWRSLTIAYTLGVVVTFITILISAWRASRVNIVQAIRDTPEPERPRESRRWLILGVLGVALGLMLLVAGISGDNAFAFNLGISLIPLSIAAVLRRFGAPARIVYSVAALLVLVFWLLPASVSDRVFPNLSGGLEMFFLSGVMLVASATVILVWNAQVVTGLLGVLGRAFSRWLPAVKTAVAYPLANRSRTGMTIAMFSLVIFSLVMMATINTNATAIMFSKQSSSGGWDVQAIQSPTNPIDDFAGTLASNGFDRSRIVATGSGALVPGGRSEVRQLGTTTWKTYNVIGANPDFIDASQLPLKTRVDGYDSDQAVWAAVRDQPNLAVIDAAAVPNPGTFSIGGPSFKLVGIKPSDTHMQPLMLEIGNPVNGATQAVEIIGIIDSKNTMLVGVFTSARTLDAIFPQPPAYFHVVRLQPGANVKAGAKDIESTLITYGVQATAYQEIIEDATRVSRGMLTLLEGFMMLGLVVGIAALGVISFRSVVERRQQIGMLRAIGFQRAMVAATFLVESTMITILGVLSGTVLGLILARNLMAGDYFGAGSGETFIIPWFTVGLFAVIALIASLLMAYIPSRRAARVPIAEALRYQ